MSRRSRLLAVLLLACGGTFAGPPAAHADVVVAVCTGGGLSVEVENGVATVAGEVTDCFSPLRPSLTSAQISGTGEVTVSLGATVVTTQDTVTWNTGESTTATETRTVVRVGSSFALVGAGASVSGLFHPAVAAETGTNGSGSGNWGAFNGNFNGNANWGSFNGNDNGNYNGNWNGNNDW